MILSEVEKVVRLSLTDEPRIAVEARRDRGVVYITLHLAESGGAHGNDRLARIWTSGAEGFYLETGDGLSYAEFDYDEEDQPAVVARLTYLSRQYLLGNYKEVEMIGDDGEVKRQLEISLAGKVYPLREPKMWNPIRTVKRWLFGR